MLHVKSIMKMASKNGNCDQEEAYSLLKSGEINAIECYPGVFDDGKNVFR